MKNIVFIADYFYSDYPGGGESNNEELIKILIESGHDITKIHSSKCFESTIEENTGSFFIIANFSHLSELSKEALLNEFYVIIEHDHKYLLSRNPAEYPDFKVPKKEIVNETFYKNAIRVFCQSTFHKNIVNRNLKLPNLESLGGNMWSEEILDYIKQLNEKYPVETKKEIYSILNNETEHKNTNGSINYCKDNKFQYEILNFFEVKEFLSKLAQNKYFAFFPLTPETLSRLLVEARMLNVVPTTKENCGAIYEEWYSLSGNELVDRMRTKRMEIANKIMETIK